MAEYTITIRIDQETTNHASPAASDRLLAAKRLRNSFTRSQADSAGGGDKAHGLVLLPRGLVVATAPGLALLPGRPAPATEAEAGSGAGSDVR